MSYDTMSPADIKALTNGDNFGLGGDGSWFIIILFLFAFLGWGGNGWNSNNSGAMDNYVLNSDFATLQRQIDNATQGLERKGDTINAGLCDGFYAMNTGLLNGFAGVNSAVQGATSAVQTQIAENGSATREAISGVNYNMAMNSNAVQNAITNGFCTTNYNNQTNARDIIDNQNNNARAILDAINAQAIAQKDLTIADQKQQIFQLQLAASQGAQTAMLNNAMAAQTNQLISAIAPAPVPAYTVANPNASVCSGCGI